MPAASGPIRETTEQALRNGPSLRGNCPGVTKLSRSVPRLMPSGRKSPWDCQYYGTKPNVNRNFHFNRKNLFGVDFIHGPTAPASP